MLEHVTPKVILFYADSASHQNTEMSLCTEKDKDKFSLWVMFASTMAVFQALTIQWLEQALTSLITWITDGPSTFVKCIQLNNACSSAMLSQSVTKKKL